MLLVGVESVIQTDSKAKHKTAPPSQSFQGKFSKLKWSQHKDEIEGSVSTTKVSGRTQVMAVRTSVASLEKGKEGGEALSFRNKASVPLSGFSVASF